MSKKFYEVAVPMSGYTYYKVLANNEAEAKQTVREGNGLYFDKLFDEDTDMKKWHVEEMENENTRV